MDISTIIIIIVSLILSKIIVYPVNKVIIKQDKIKLEYTVNKSSDSKKVNAIAKEGVEGDSLPLVDLKGHNGTMDELDYIVPTDTDRGQKKEGDK